MIKGLSDLRKSSPKTGTRKGRAWAEISYAKKGVSPCVSVEPDVEVSIVFDLHFCEDSLTERELILIRSILPEVFKEITFQAEPNKE